jgi:RimJ/RimL family protein N-acetyltransferase
MNATLRKFERADFGKLVRMYVDFEPKGEFQGLPPRSLELIRRWLSALIEMGDEQFVIEVGERIVGHSMLCFAHDKTEAELAVFLHQDFRGLGLGRKLLLGTLNYGCKQRELDRVWLSVQGCNPRAQHLFESVGFNMFGERSPLQWELDMTRRSHCVQCKGDACAIFSETLPQVIRGPASRRR